MKKFIYTTFLFFTTFYSFSQYFVIGEMDSENQSDTMEFLDLWMSGTKEVVGENLNMSIFQKELSNTHFFVRSVSSLQEWVDQENASDEVGAKVFAKMGQVENIQDIFQSFLKATHGLLYSHWALGIIQLFLKLVATQ